MSGQEFLFNRILMEKARCGLQMRLGAQPLNDMTFTVTADHFSDDMIWRMETDLLRHQVGSVTEEQTRLMVWVRPDGRWQRFKQRHCDAWWYRALRAVHLTREIRLDSWTETVGLRVTADAWATFPHNNRVFPPGQDYVEFLRPQYPSELGDPVPTTEAHSYGWGGVEP